MSGVHWRGINRLLDLLWELLQNTSFMAGKGIFY